MDNLTKAPEFTLQDTQGNELTLAELTKEKHLVIVFFPLAFSSVCTDEVCAIKDNMKVYESLNAEVVGISVDSIYALRAFKKSYNLNFKLLSDFNKEVSKKYGVLQQNFFGMKGVSKRAVFVVNQKGDIIHEEVLADAGNQPDFFKVQEVLSST